MFLRWRQQRPPCHDDDDEGEATKFNTVHIAHRNLIASCRNETSSVVRRIIFATFFGVRSNISRTILVPSVHLENVLRTIFSLEMEFIVIQALKMIMNEKRKSVAPPYLSIWVCYDVLHALQYQRYNWHILFQKIHSIECHEVSSKLL